jgi:adenine-specific DNA-methyltransferase
MAKSTGKNGSKSKRNDGSKKVETLVHEEARRTNIPTAEYQGMLEKGDPELRRAYERRNRDLDPQLVWRGKDEQDWSDLVVMVPPLYIQEKVHPKALIDDLLRQTREDRHEAGEQEADLFADFNGIPKGVDKTEFYQHDQNWSNRMILGDSLQVMASLAEREGLRGKVQCIYIDPPYGIKFNSNFQWSTTSRDVKDGNAAHITREPEQVKAFRDTWRDGIHSYLTYLRDRLTVARDLLSDSGSIFVQIGDENVHRVRALMDEVFGDSNVVSQINFKSMGALGQSDIPNVYDYIIWYAKSKGAMKFRPLYRLQDFEQDPEYRFVADAGAPEGHRILNSGYSRPHDNEGLFRRSTLTSSGFTPSCTFNFDFEGATFKPFGRKSWRTNFDGMSRLSNGGRVFVLGGNIYFRRFANDAQLIQFENSWRDAPAAAERIFVVQTAPKFVERCLLMATDPGDLVLDPTCGSGTTATVAEQWGRRWITIDTSRVALALARARVMGARYPYYLLADSREGQLKEAEATHSTPSSQRVQGDIGQGFVYERVPHITLKSIANNVEIDVIWEKWQLTLQSLRKKLNEALKKSWQEWEVPRDAESSWPEATKKLHADWWQARIARQKEIDASIATKAEFESLYDKPYEDRKTVRVAGPFTVESLSPHRVLDVDENDELIDSVMEQKTGYAAARRDFPSIILENLKTAGVQQSDKSGKIDFTALTPWPGDLVCADGRYMEGSKERRAAIFIGPEFGTVTRPDLVTAAREAAESGFDVLIACSFNFEAHTTEFARLGKVPVLKARMNADLHMADDLRKTNKANLFVIFGEPDIDIVPDKNNRIRVKVNGVDVFDPSTGEVRSDDVDGIACWFIDTDYNEESFFVRHAYFLGANDPYKALKTTLKAEIDEEAWESLHSDTSRPFDKPKSGRIAVKVINHLGDEVMKVFRV